MVRNVSGAAMLLRVGEGLPAMSCSVLRRVCLVFACLLPVLATAADAPADKPSSDWADPATAAAEIRPLAAKSLLLDVVRSGARYVAVGARGDVLLSDDGRDWRQVEVPTRATLTAVSAIDAQRLGGRPRRHDPAQRRRRRALGDPAQGSVEAGQYRRRTDRGSSAARRVCSSMRAVASRSAPIAWRCTRRTVARRGSR